MTKRATITRWNADKGFGFMRSADTPADIFFHIKDWRGVDATPRPGLTVDYEEIHVGGKGPRGVAVRPAAQARAAASRDRPQRPAAARSESSGSGVSRPVAAAWMALVAGGCISGRLPLWVLPAFALLNLATFFAYSFDKYKARKGQWRTPEQTLHWFALLGGWPAAMVARHDLRHKSSKKSFIDRDHGMAVLNVLAMLAWAFARLPA